MDAIDRQIVEALVADARISLKNLSTRVKLSSPSVSERLRRLEERGVIRAFTVDLDPRALGYQLEAIVRIRALPGKGQIVQEQLRQIPEITECDKVTGEDCFIARLVIRTMEELDPILSRIADKAETNTSLIKSHTIRRRLPPLAAPGERPKRRRAARR